MCHVARKQIQKSYEVTFATLDDHDEFVVESWFRHKWANCGGLNYLTYYYLKNSESGLLAKLGIQLDNCYYATYRLKNENFGNALKHHLLVICHGSHLSNHDIVIDLWLGYTKLPALQQYNIARNRPPYFGFIGSVAEYQALLDQNHYTNQQHISSGLNNAQTISLGEKFIMRPDLEQRIKHQLLKESISGCNIV